MTVRVRKASFRSAFSFLVRASSAYALSTAEPVSDGSGIVVRVDCWTCGPGVVRAAGSGTRLLDPGRDGAGWCGLEHEDDGSVGGRTGAPRVLRPGSALPA